MKNPTGELKSALIGAAREFLETMVVIDDRIRMGGDLGPQLKAGANLVKPEYGVPKQPQASVSPEKQIQTGYLGDDLNLTSLVIGATRERLICSLIDPTTFSPVDVVSELTSVLEKSDICVLDWSISGFDDGELTMQLIENLISSDQPTRHRVICIYSHVSSPEHEFQKVVKRFSKLQREGKKFILKFESIVIVWLSKQIRETEGFELQHVKEENLASNLVELFAMINPGLVPLFVLKALTRVRKNTLGIVARYKKNADAGFVAEMALQSSSHVSDLQLADAIGSDLSGLVAISQTSDWLSEEAFTEWLRNSGVKIEPESVNLAGEDEENVVREVARVIRDQDRESSLEYLSEVIGKLNAASSKDFAELLCCEANFESSVRQLKPGTIVRRGVDEYLVCVQPLCDSFLRGAESTRKFPFVRLSLKFSSTHVAFRDTKTKVHYAKPKLYDLEYYVLSRNRGNTVVSENGVFKTCCKPAQELHYVGRLRSEHIQRLHGLLGYDASRVGLSESEKFRKGPRSVKPDDKPPGTAAPKEVAQDNLQS